ncbi:MAG: MBOAT family O-acyltransferase [Treponema sp.]
MLFNSVQFLLFFIVITVLYFIGTHKIKKPIFTQCFLLAASLYFYMAWHPKYIVLILTSIFITYTSGILMERYNDRKKLFLIISILLNLLILFFFKYLHFSFEIVQQVCTFFNQSFIAPHFDFLLPVGISFYTFQALGYSIDVYKGSVKAEKNFITYALFVTFFPQLVAGPIERTEHLLPQFKQNHYFNPEMAVSGLKLTAWGLFQKMVIADRLAVYVNAVYADISSYNSLAVLLAVVFFSFQILCDFAGYSNIAIGVARILGFDLMKNFNAPYLAVSIKDFWNRWHISLSSYFRDYVYIPLGGNKVGKPRYMLNILITFVISGLWHGAGWNFMCWGFLHAVYQIVASITGSIRKKIIFKIPILNALLYSVRICFTFVLVTFAWIFFRAKTISDALLVLKKISYFFTDLTTMINDVSVYGVIGSIKKGLFLTTIIEQNIIAINGFGIVELAISFFVIFVLIMSDIINQKEPLVSRIKNISPVCKFIAYYIFILFIIFFGMYTNNQFIYFQF